MHLHGSIDRGLLAHGLAVVPSPGHEELIALAGQALLLRAVRVIAVEPVAFNERLPQQPYRRRIVGIVEQVRVVFVLHEAHCVGNAVLVVEHGRNRIAIEGRPCDGLVDLESRRCQKRNGQYRNRRQPGYPQSPTLRVRRKQRPLHLADVCVAVFRIEGRALGDDLLEWTVHADVFVLAGTPGEQAAQQHAKRVDVGARVGLRKSVLLGRCVGPRAEEHRVGLAAFAVRARDVEVDERDRPVRPHDDVLGLYVAMDDRLGAVVKVGQDVAELGNEARDFLLAKIVLARIAFEGRSLDVGAHDDGAVLVLEARYVTRQRWVVEHLQDVVGRVDAPYRLVVALGNVLFAICVLGEERVAAPPLAQTLHHGIGAREPGGPVVGVGDVDRVEQLVGSMKGGLTHAWRLRATAGRTRRAAPARP